MATSAVPSPPALRFGSTLRHALAIARDRTVVRWTSALAACGALVGILVAPSIVREELLVVWPAILVLAMLVGTCQGGLAWIAWSRRSGKSVTFGDVVDRLRSRAGRVAMASAIVGVLCVMGANCAGIGLVLVAADECAVLPSLFEDEGSAWQAVSRGRALVRGRRTVIVGLYLSTLVVIVIGVFVAIVPIVFVLFELAHLRGDALHAGELACMAGCLVGLFGGVWGSVAAAIYVTLREQRDGVDARVVAEVFS